jgi:hypothetical protein
MTALAEEFKLTGSACARSYLDDETVGQLRGGAAKLIERFTRHGRTSPDYWNYEVEAPEPPVLYRIHNLEKQDWPEARLLYDPRLARLAEEFIGGSVEPTAFALVLKEPSRASGVPWHRDRTNVSPHTVCNLSLCLDDADTGNGCLESVPGSHLLPDDADVLAVRDGGPRVAIVVSAGDVVIHDVRVVHGSGPNPTDRWRRTIVIEFAGTDLGLAG